MNGISFHTARGQRITNVEFSRAQTQAEIGSANEQQVKAERAAETDDETKRKQQRGLQGDINFGDESDAGKDDAITQQRKYESERSAPVTDQHPSTATDPSASTATDPSASKAKVRFTLYGGETVTVDTDKLQFKGAAKGRPADERTGLPSIQVGNDGALNNPANHRIDQAAQQSDWLVQYYDWRDDETKYAVFDSATLHAVTRRGAN